MSGGYRMELNEGTHILEGAQTDNYGETKETPLDKAATTPADSPTTPDITSDTYRLMRGADDEDEKEKSNIPMASFNFINSIIGSGIIGMPYALKQAGFGLGCVLILLTGLLTDYSIRLLIYGGTLSNTNTYQDLVRAAFGRPGFLLLTIMQALYPFIAMISYNVIMGDTITKIVIRVGGEWVRHSILGKRQFIIIIFTIFTTLPLSLYRNVARLSKMAITSISCIVLLGGTIIYRILVPGWAQYIPVTAGAWEFANTQFTQAIGIMAFAFMCHHNSFLIYDSLKDRTEERWNTVTHMSVVFAMLCTLIFGIAGYATFTGFTQGDLLENYCYDDDLMNISRFLFAITIMLTFPIECFVVREVVENSLFASQQQPVPLKRHVGLTVVIVALTVIISMATDCLGIVLQINGVLCASPLAYILPPLCVLRLKQEKILSYDNIPCLLTALYGTAVALVGLVVTVADIVNGVTCSHGQEMAYCFTESGNQTIPGYVNGTLTYLSD